MLLHILSIQLQSHSKDAKDLFSLEEKQWMQLGTDYVFRMEIENARNVDAMWIKYKRRFRE